MAIITFIFWVDYPDYRNEFVKQCIEDGTYYNLICRLEEIRSEL